MAKVNPYELADDDPADTSLDASEGPDRDGVSALHDVEAEAGDEEGLGDTYDMDDREARELGVQLDDRDEPEPRPD
jgi:hypothetical protein